MCASIEKLLAELVDKVETRQALFDSNVLNLLCGVNDAALAVDQYESLCAAVVSWLSSPSDEEANDSMLSANFKHCVIEVAANSLAEVLRLENSAFSAVRDDCHNHFAAVRAWVGEPLGRAIDERMRDEQFDYRNEVINPPCIRLLLPRRC
jgi:hypothetical protein